MKLKSVTWNIGGGKSIKPGEDPMLLASYAVDGIEGIARWLKQNEPDIIALQEVHGDDRSNQIEYIANYLGYDYYLFDPVAISHIDSTQSLGNGIISRYPISNQRIGRFLNPKIEIDLQTRTEITHDKGYVTCDISIQDTLIRATSLHLIPFRKVGLELDSEMAKKILSSISSELPRESTYIVQLVLGDFNIDASTVSEHLEELVTANDLSEVEINDPTAPDGRTYDHILYGGLVLESVGVDTTVETDHYPVICSFELQQR